MQVDTVPFIVLLIAMFSAAGMGVSRLETMRPTKGLWAVLAVGLIALVCYFANRLDGGSFVVLLLFLTFLLGHKVQSS